MQTTTPIPTLMTSWLTTCYTGAASTFCRCQNEIQGRMCQPDRHEIFFRGASAFKSVATWKKGKPAGIEVDFTVDVIDARTRIPVECKATTSIQKRHYKNIIHYLDLTGQKFGILVSAAPYEKIVNKGRIILNLPIYLANRPNIIKYFNLNSIFV